LPHLRIISAFDNPFHCDCTAQWIEEAIGQTNNENNTLVFNKAQSMVCDTPEHYHSTRLAQIPSNKLGKLCSPVVIPMFNDSNHLEIGQTLTYPCRAIGEPLPHIQWILPNGKILNGTSNFSRLKIDSLGTLTIDHLKPMDAGKYTCVASTGNGQLYDTATTVLRIHNKDIHVLDQGVATNFITVTWNGTGSTMTSSDYILLFKQKDFEDEYHTIDLRPYMRTYTITNLHPHTVYEFCIAYRHEKTYQKLNCMDIQTKRHYFMMTGIRSMGNLSIFIALVIIASLVCFLCLATVAIKKYKRRKSYQEPDGENVPRKVEGLSQIPLDNIYHPPSTPLCASTVSLIPSSSA
jgi:hypothetical protein